MFDLSPVISFPVMGKYIDFFITSYKKNRSGPLAGLHLLHPCCHWSRDSAYWKRRRRRRRRFIDSSRRRFFHNRVC